MDPELLAKARDMVQRMRGDGVPDAAIDAYLQKQIGAGLKDVEKPGLRDYARAAGMGASLGFEDELAGLGAAIAPGGKDYTEARDEVRHNYEAAKKAAPIRMGAAELAGGIGSALAGGAVLGTAAKGASLGARIAGGALSGVAAGGASGVGYSNDHPVAAGLTGAVIGGATGAALPAVGAVLGKVGKAVVNRFSPTTNVAKAAGHLLPDNAAATMTAREALAPGTTVPAALSPELPMSVRHIGADAALGRVAQAESESRLAGIQSGLRDIGDQMEQLLSGRLADVDQPQNAPIRKIIVKNGLIPSPHSSGADVVDLKVVQALRNKLRERVAGQKGMTKHATAEDIRTLSDWLAHQAPDIGKLDQDYATLSRARKAEELILKNIRQSRKAYSSSRAAGIEPGSPGASLPSTSASKIFDKILQPDRKSLAEAANRLLLQPGRIPPELLKQRAAMPTRVPSLAATLGLGELGGSLSSSLYDSLR